MERQSWVIRLRFVVIAVFSANYILGIPIDDPWVLWERAGFAISVVVISMAANIIWRIALKTNRLTPDALAYYQCIFDLLAVSLIVYRHGPGSAASYLYIIVILMAGLLLPKRGILVIAFACTVLYMIFDLMQINGYLVPLPIVESSAALLPSEIHFLLGVVIKGFFFFIIAFSCAHLQDLLHRMTRESEFLADFNSQVIQMIPVGVVVMNIAREIEVFNPAMVRISWIDAVDAIGKHVSDVFPGIDTAWNEALERVEKTGEEVRLLGTLLPIANGKTIRVNARLEPLRMKDQILAVVCTIQTAHR